MKGGPGILLPLMGWLGGLLVVVALALLLVVARSRHRLESYKAELEQRGETFDVAKLTPPTPPKKNNGADELVAATTELRDAITARSLKPFSTGRLEKMPGQAEVVHKRHATMSAKKDVAWEKFRSDMEPLRPIFARVRLSAKAPILDIQPDYSPGFATHLPFGPTFLKSCQFLAAENILLLRDGQVTKTVENIETMLAMAGITNRQPNWISQLISASIIQITSCSTWEVLQANASRQDLLRLQNAWLSIIPGAVLTDTLRMERAWGVNAFSSPAELHIPSPKSGSSLERTFETASTSLWATLFRFGDEYWFLTSNQQILDSLANDDWKAALKNSKDIQASLESAGISRKLSQLIFQTLGDLLEKMAATDATHELCITAIAIRRYQLDHDSQLPKSLQALVPSYLNTIPKDIMDGEPLHYRRDGQNFHLYSLGENGTDDGGNPGAFTGKKHRGFPDGLDIVWPQAIPPVTPTPGGSGPDTPPE